MRLRIRRVEEGSEYEKERRRKRMRGEELITPIVGKTTIGTA